MTKSATERAEAQQWAEKVQSLEAEIERLKDTIQFANKVMDAKDAEIERLEERWRDSEPEKLWMENQSLKAEIERLRAIIESERQAHTNKINAISRTLEPRP